MNSLKLNSNTEVDLVASKYFDYRYNCCLISILSFNPLNRRSSRLVKGGEKVRSTVKNWATLA
jgi:hypothetical protein